MSKKLQKRGPKSKYSPAVLDQIETYLSMCSREQTQLPSVEGLALYLGLNKSTLYEWAKEKPELSDGLKKIASKQKEQLMNDGMYGGKEVNASMAIFLLKALHGLKDQPTIMQQFNVGGKMGIEFIDNDESSAVPLATKGSKG